MTSPLTALFALLAFAAAAAEPSTLSARDLLMLREIGGYSGNLSVSPDGSFVAFPLQQADFATRSYKTTWHVVPVDGGEPIFLGEGGAAMLTPSTHGRINGARDEVKAQWSPDGRWIAYLRTEAGQVQIWRSRADGTVQEQVTRNAADVMDFGWIPDGSGIWFKVGRSREEMRRSDQEEGDRGYLLDERFIPDYSLKPLWYPCGEQLRGVPLPDSQMCTPSAWVVLFGSAERALLDDQEIQAFTSNEKRQHPLGISAQRKIQNIVWNAEETRAAWLENEEPDRHPGPGAPLTLFTDGMFCGAPECHGQLRKVWWNGAEIVFLKKEGHSLSIPALYVWRPGDSQVRLIYRFDGVLESCEIGRGRLICLHETPMTPRKIVSIGLADRKLVTLFDPNLQFGRYRLGAVERIEWRDAFGNPTFGHLVYPPGYEKRRPCPLVVVQYRSRGFLKGGVGEEYPIFPLAAAGFMVLSFDRPDDWDIFSRYDNSTPASLGVSEAEEWKNAYERRRAVTALEVILDQLVERGIADPARIGITGLSDGSETATFALFNSQRYAAAAISGSTTPDSYYLAVNETLRALWRAILQAQSGPEAVEKWKPYSLMHNVDKMAVPLLIQVSDSELIATTPLHVTLKDAGKPVETYVFPAEYHIKSQPQHKLAVAERTIDWFRFWLMDEEDADPSKAEQYSRWRRLRERRDQQSTDRMKALPTKERLGRQAH